MCLVLSLCLSEPPLVRAEHPAGWVAPTALGHRHCAREKKPSMHNLCIPSIQHALMFICIPAGVDEGHVVARQRPATCVRQKLFVIQNK